MSNSAYIREIASLDQLRIEIARFCEESENQLNAIDLKMQSRLADLIALESRFLDMLISAREDLQHAERDLNYCKSNTYEDENGNDVEPDCNFEFEQRILCQERLDYAEYNYEAFRREIRNIENSIAEYHKPKIKYKTLVEFEKEAAIGSLKQLINGAEDYLSVSTPFGNEFSSGLGITETVAKIDPTMMVATSIGVSEIMMMSVFSFLSNCGNLYRVVNKKNNGLITTIISENGTEHTCSQLKIEKRESGNFAKIISVNIPSSLQNEKIGRPLINNMEVTCRANDCNEISGWASSSNVDFYKGIGYQTRNEIKDTGAEVFKPLESSFYLSQQHAKAAFEKVSNVDFSKSKSIRKQTVNPLNIISPDEMNEEKFWQHHGENQCRYVELVEKFDKCNQLLQSGKTLDEIRKEDNWIANAYDVFHSSEPIKLLRSDDYYRIDSNGRHRVAAAQIYYLQTGKIVPINADVLEKE